MTILQKKSAEGDVTEAEQVSQLHADSSEEHTRGF
jgi:hypothetical protein